MRISSALLSRGTCCIYAPRLCRSSGTNSKPLCTGTARAKHTTILKHSHVCTQSQSLPTHCTCYSSPWLVFWSSLQLWGSRQDWRFLRRWFLLRWRAVRWRKNGYNFCRWYRFWWGWEDWYICRAVIYLTCCLLFTAFYEKIIDSF